MELLKHPTKLSCSSKIFLCATTKCEETLRCVLLPPNRGCGLVLSSLGPVDPRLEPSDLQLQYRGQRFLPGGERVACGCCLGDVVCVFFFGGGCSKNLAGMICFFVPM